ncbi:MAG: hypothetical protein ACTHMO_00085 [Rhodanobacteraceae bacterium]
MNEWEEMHAEPLGEVEEIVRKLDSVLGGLHWSTIEDAWNGLGTEQDRCYLDIWLHPGEDGSLRFIVMNKAPPSAMRKVCDAFGLNYVAAPEAGDLVDVHAYDDGDIYYARKNPVA